MGSSVFQLPLDHTRGDVDFPGTFNIDNHNSQVRGVRCPERVGVLAAAGPRAYGERRRWPTMIPIDIFINY